MDDVINHKLNKLIGLPIRDIGRLTNLLWISIGQSVTVVRRNNTVEVTGEYAMHIQCSWRLIKNNNIIVASQDFYLPSSKISDKELESFDWESQYTRFDEQIDKIFHDAPINILIKKIIVDDLGGLQISLSDGYSLEIFPDTSTEEEVWRLFEPGNTDSHLVMTGVGIEEDDE